jgi:hypothetical protein
VPLAGSIDVAAASHLSRVLTLACENNALLHPDNAQAVECLYSMRGATALLCEQQLDPSETLHRAELMWALHSLTAAAARMSAVITADSSWLLRRLQPACSHLEKALNIGDGQGAIALENAVRSMPHAPAAQLLAIAEPALKRVLGLPAWRVVAPFVSEGGVASGRLRREASLAAVQTLVFAEPVVLIVDQVRWLDLIAIPAA